MENATALQRLIAVAHALLNNVFMGEDLHENIVEIVVTLTKHRPEQMRTSVI